MVRPAAKFIQRNNIFKQQFFAELFVQKVIPVVIKCLIWFIFHRWPYKIRKLSENSVGHMNKISHDKISGNFSNSIYHRWKQKINLAKQNKAQLVLLLAENQA